MLCTVYRTAGRHGFAGQRLRQQVCRAGYATSLSSSLRIRSIPAPHSGEITVVSLNRPKARNAISRQLLGELSHIVKQIHAEGGKSSTRALVLASESDDAFCAGADLKERLTFTEEDTRDFLATLRETLSLLSSLAIPTISAVNGTALGGGLELALATNFRIMGTTSSVGLPETRIAIIPGAGGTYRLPALIGEHRARDLILTGRRVGGAEAYFLGLCDRLVDITEEDAAQEGLARQKILEQALVLATSICEGGPLAIGAAMQALAGWQQGEQSENLAYEGLLTTADRVEALKAFGEKRVPVFKAR